MRGLWKAVRYSGIGVFFTGIITVIQGCDAKEGAAALLLLFLLQFCSGPGDTGQEVVCTDLSTVAALITAIEIANASGGTIDLCPVTFTLTTALTGNNDGTFGPTAFPEITNAITINGNGATIERDAGADSFRFFYVSGTGNLTLNDLTVKSGRIVGPNGASPTNGIEGNGGGGTGGGGAGLGGSIYIAPSGQMTANNVSFEDNQVTGGNALDTMNIGSGNGGTAGGGFDGSGGNGGAPGGGVGTVGGFGGGGGGGGGNFGGTGGAGRAGGFGAGGGGGGDTGGAGGSGGFGGGNGGTGANNGGILRGGGGGGGAGIGGAVFNNQGSVTLINATFTNNLANPGNGGTSLFGGDGNPGQGLCPNVGQWDGANLTDENGVAC